MGVKRIKQSKKKMIKIKNDAIVFFHINLLLSIFSPFFISYVISISTFKILYLPFKDFNIP